MNPPFEDDRGEPWQPLPHAAEVDPAMPRSDASSLVGQDVIMALAPDLRSPPRPRRVRLPLLLFVATCLTTFLAGCYHWYPVIVGQPAPLASVDGGYLRDAHGQEAAFGAWDLVQRNWQDGLVYMVCVMGILFFHEMGHFLMTVRYRIPASFPFFIPLPVMITGTMGAVIGMDGSRANRKEVFDIGLAGPLAGLVLTIPLLIVGLTTAQWTFAESNMPVFGSPLLMGLLERWLIHLPEQSQLIYNPFLMAGWVGLFVTGLNMLPISQLDGGHVAYAVLGRYSRWLGRGLLLLAIAFIVKTNSLNWIPMLLIVIFMGADHPRTADDTVKLGPLRWTLGLVSLLIPIFCFIPVPMSVR